MQRRQARSTGSVALMTVLGTAYIQATGSHGVPRVPECTHARVGRLSRTPTSYGSRAQLAAHGDGREKGTVWPNLRQCVGHHKEPLPGHA